MNDSFFDAQTDSESLIFNFRSIAMSLAPDFNYL